MSDAAAGEKPKTNEEIRRRYKERVAEIARLNGEWLARGLSARQRAEKAWRIRHEARLEARSMMTDAAEVLLLMARDFKVYGNAEGPTLEFLIEHLRRAGLEGDAIYEAIIDGSFRTNIEFNKKPGL